MGLCSTSSRLRVEPHKRYRARLVEGMYFVHEPVAPTWSSQPERRASRARPRGGRQIRRRALKQRRLQNWRRGFSRHPTPGRRQADFCRCRLRHGHRGYIPGHASPAGWGTAQRPVITDVRAGVLLRARKCLGGEDRAGALRSRGGLKFSCPLPTRSAQQVQSYVTATRP